MTRVFAIVAVLCWIGTAHADPAKLVVIVAKGSKITNISMRNLKRGYAGDPFSADDERLVPFNAPVGSSERAGFDRRVLGMSPAEVGRYWIDRKVRGQSGAPRSLPSAAHMVKVVAKFPHAIGYVSAEQLTADVQPVAVDGIPYTDARYPIAGE